MANYSLVLIAAALACVLYASPVSARQDGKTNSLSSLGRRLACSNHGCDTHEVYYSTDDSHDPEHKPEPEHKPKHKPRKFKIPAIAAANSDATAVLGGVGFSNGNGAALAVGSKVAVAGTTSEASASKKEVKASSSSHAIAIGR